MPLTTPEQQRAAAEAARAEGDKNPKADPKEEINALEKQIAELKEKQKVLKPAVSETPGPSLAKLNPLFQPLS
jgi:uncharacterized protein YceH (UPF0502 family)